MATIKQGDSVLSWLKKIWKKMLDGLQALVLLQNMDNNLTTIQGDVATISTDTTAIAVNTNQLETLITDLSNRDILDKWTLVPGNIKTFTYYAGNVGPDHPSSSVNEVEFERYIQGASTVLTVRYTYNINNNVTSVTAS